MAAGADEADGLPPLDLVFVSACHSVQGGEAFVAAGVPHVVAVRREAQLQDKAACAFADAFYFALFKGKSVQQAFDIARQAVSNDPSVLRAESESAKFLLLPHDADHSHALFAEAADGPYAERHACHLHASCMPPACLLHASCMPPACLLHASCMPPACLLHASRMPPAVPCLLHAAAASMSRPMPRWRPESVVPRDMHIHVSHARLRAHGHAHFT